MLRVVIELSTVAGVLANALFLTLPEAALPPSYVSAVVLYGIGSVMYSGTVQESTGFTQIAPNTRKIGLYRNNFTNFLASADGQNVAFQVMWEVQDE